ncbi:MAG: ABC transporter permease [Thermobifida fusca]|uniref:ABC transporter permease n=1 Tax=Thermobifida sp. TaxID=2027107 RepID=UPI000DB7B106|nr:MULTISPECIES: ABC transporter permease [Thermobifida]MBO2528660.1 ABC transporter permease [Thermobifida sp.]PZN61548.1 MAG: ABC transporter permease [Thermobifida fusca]
MFNVLLAEGRKALTGRSWLYLLGGGILFGVTVAYGYATSVEDTAAVTTQVRASVTEEVIRAWMTMHLFSTLFGAVFVAGEYHTGTISRSVLLSGGRGRLFAAKMIVGTVMGVLFGLVAAGAALLSPLVFIPTFADFSPEWTTVGWQTALGVFAVTALGTCWGVALGWVVRHQVASVLIIVLLTLGLEPYLLRAVPEVAKYLLTIAMSSVYLDGKPELLSVPAALAVICGWIVATGAAGYQLLRTRDIT